MGLLRLFYHKARMLSKQKLFGMDKEFQIFGFCARTRAARRVQGRSVSVFCTETAGTTEFPFAFRLKYCWMAALETGAVW